MSLPIQQQLIVDELAGELYELLPGSVPPGGNLRLTFPGVAHQLGLGQFWSGGSKRPAIVQLLMHTLARERGKFGALIAEIVKASMRKYPAMPNLSRQRVLRLVDLAQKIGCGVPEVGAQDFLALLPSGEVPPAPVHPPHVSASSVVANEARVTGSPTSTTSGVVTALGNSQVPPVPSPKPPSVASRTDALRAEFASLLTMAPQARGYAFETFLTALWAAHGFDPRSSFRNVGEQIDGSFVLGEFTYIVEARWHNTWMDAGDLRSFDVKVASKPHARGLMISYGGYSEQGLIAFQTGYRPSIICMNGADLYSIVNGALPLSDVIRLKLRRASEGSGIFVSVRDLFPGVHGLV